MRRDPSANIEQPDADSELLRRASRAAVWNALLLPLLAGANLALSVLVRREFGLRSGVYDVVLGLASALLLYSSLGIPSSLSKFLPEISASTDAPTLRRFLRQASTVRMGALVLTLLLLNGFGARIATALDLGIDGRLYLALLSILVVARATFDLAVKTLNAFFAQVASNTFSLMQAALDLLLVGGVLFAGYQMAGLLAGLAASAVVVAIGSASFVWVRLQTLSRSDTPSGPIPSPSERRDTMPWLAGQGPRFFRFSLFTYPLGVLGFFSDMGFVAPALALTLTTDQVALFATAFKMSFMTMTLVIAGFRGLYQPVFARLRARNDPAQLQRAFTILTKGQLIILLPAGLGLTVMTGDYLPLLFGREFDPAVPIAQVLVLFMFASVLFNVPGILLTVDERYRAVLWIQAIPAVVAPLFLVASATGGLVAAAAVFGAARLATALVAYAVSRRVYGLTFPWAFASRIAAVSLVMAAVVAVGRAGWAPSPTEATVLSGVGVVVFCLGLRVSRALGPDEVDLLRRSQVPGHTWILWLLTSRR